MFLEFQVRLLTIGRMPYKLGVSASPWPPAARHHRCFTQRFSLSATAKIRSGKL